MPDPNAGLPPRYLRTPEAARFLGLSGRTLEKHRTYGTGPRYSKIGGRVVYAIEDLQAWVSRGEKNSTSDDTGDEVLPAKRHAAISPAYARKARSGAAGPLSNSSGSRSRSSTGFASAGSRGQRSRAAVAAPSLSIPAPSSPSSAGRQMISVRRKAGSTFCARPEQVSPMRPCRM